MTIVKKNEGFSRCVFFLRCGAVRCDFTEPHHNAYEFCFNKSAPHLTVALSILKIHTEPHRWPRVLKNQVIRYGVGTVRCDTHIILP